MIQQSNVYGNGSSRREFGRAFNQGSAQYSFKEVRDSFASAHNERTQGGD